MEEIQDKEQYAKVLIANAERAIKIIKILVIVGAALAGFFIVYGILALTVIPDKKGALIGLLVILACAAVIFATLIAMFAYAKVNLNKLKKLG